MKRLGGSLAIVAAFLLACGPAEEESPMEGMTAEEHALMMAGGTQGSVDSTGAMIRQPVHLSAAQERALGVVYTTVRRGSLARTIRTVGQIQTPGNMARAAIVCSTGTGVHRFW